MEQNSSNVIFVITPVRSIILTVLFLLSFKIVQSQWVQLGPAPTLGGQTEGITNNPVSGAVNCVTPHRTDANILYIGTVNGGVWRTDSATDSFPNWTYISENISSQSIGALEFDPTDASNKTLVVGNGHTSSLSGRGSGSRGIFKTTSGKNPWFNIDPSGMLPDKDIRGLAPRGNVIVVALEDVGIFRTTDGGNTWTKISGLSGSDLPLGETDDLISDPNDHAVLYTVVDDKGVYKSIDTGATWEKISNSDMDKDLEDAILSRMAVGNNTNVYVGIVSKIDLQGLYRLGNAGLSWLPLPLPHTYEDGVTLGSFNGKPSTHLFSIATDASDSYVVYVGGRAQPGPLPNSLWADAYSGRLFRIDGSLQAGTQIATITHIGTSNISAPHADSRDMDFDANGDLIEGDDGGVFRRTDPKTALGDWVSLNGNLNISEAHSLDWDRLSGIPIAGLQDNGVTQQIETDSLAWDEVTGGDGGDIAVGVLGDTMSVRYSSSQYFVNFEMEAYSPTGRYKNRRSFYPDLIDVNTSISIADTDSFGFITPIKLHHWDATRLLIASRSQLYESFDQGATVNSIWTEEVNGSEDRGRDVLVYGAANQPHLIYAGVEDEVYVRTNVGGSFSRLAYNGGVVKGIIIDPSSFFRIYVIDENNVYESRDAGLKFTDISGNLSNFGDIELLSIEYLPGANLDRIALGTSEGVLFSSAPNFDFWVELGDSLPHARVEDLAFDEERQILSAATLGRGIWIYSFAESDRNPIDVSLVLDFSGSMSQEACHNCSLKVDVLKKAVEIFLQVWKLLSDTNDAVTTVYFNTNVRKPSIDGSEKLNILDYTDQIIADIKSQNAILGELTALGGGLQTGITELNDTASARHVILFTDGMQNVNPGVQYPDMEILDGIFTDDSNVSQTTPITNLEHLDEISVHTIGVGTTLDFKSQLSEISNAAGGLTRTTTNPDEDLIHFYIQSLMDILKGNSPQLVTYRRDTMNLQALESVDINRRAVKVLFKVSYAEGSPLDIQIIQDGNDVTSLARRVTGDFYDIYFYDEEQLRRIMAMGSLNNWDILLTSTETSLAYQLAAIEDVKELKYNAGIKGKKKIPSGTPVTFVTELEIDESDFTGDGEVTATLKIPSQSINELLTNYSIPQSEILEFEKGTSIWEKKLAYMLIDENYSELLKPRKSELTFNRIEDGRFEGVFTDTRIAGTYCIQFKIKGNDEKIGAFERIETQNFIVQFGKIDRKESKINFENQQENTLKLTMTPVDIYGNYLGSDQLPNLTFNIEGGKVLEEKDNGNGSYEITFRMDKVDANVEVKYKDEVWVKWQAGK